MRGATPFPARQFSRNRRSLWKGRVRRLLLSLPAALHDAAWGDGRAQQMVGRGIFAVFAALCAALGIAQAFVLNSIEPAIIMGLVALALITLGVLAE